MFLKNTILPSPFQFTGVVDEDEEDWILSSLEEEIPLPAKDGTATKKDNTNAITVVHPIGKLAKKEGILIVVSSYAQ